MRSQKFAAILLLLTLTLTLFASCRRGGGDDLTSDEISTEQAANIKQRVNFERYKKEVEMPFSVVSSPYVYGNSLYFSAAEKDAADPIPNKLIRCDLKAKVIETVFDKSDEKCTIRDISANEKWLVWSVVGESGISDVYLKDLNSGIVKLVFSAKIEPHLMGDGVYWIEKREPTAGNTSLVVVKYDCISGSKTDIQKLNQADSLSFNLHANDGFLVWTDKIGASYYYFLYNTSTGKTASFKAQKPLAGFAKYTDGLIIGTEFEEQDEKGTVRIIDTVTGRDVKTDGICPDEKDRAVSGSFIISCSELPVVHKIEEDGIKAVGTLPDYCDMSCLTGCQEGLFVCTEKADTSEDFYKRDKKLYIFDLRKLK